MKKVILSIFAIAAMTLAGFSQKGNIQVGVAAEAGFPTGDFSDLSKAGFGGTAKGLYGISADGQITFTSGYLNFGYKNVIRDAFGADKVTLSVIPILAGYRHNFSGFYVEPQIGYGIYNGKVKGGDFASSNSDGAFTWAAGVGYVYKQFEAGVRYQSAHSDGGTLSFAGVRIGYNFSVSGNK